LPAKRVGRLGLVDAVIAAMLRIWLVVCFLAGCGAVHDRADAPAPRWPKNRMKRDEEMAALRDLVKDLELRVIRLERKIEERPSQPQRVE
jgi:hypothetical protein